MWLDGLMDGWINEQENTRLLRELKSLCIFSIFHIEYGFNSTSQILMESQNHQNGLSRFLLIPGFHKNIWKNKMLFGFPFLFLFCSLLTEQNPKQILKIKI